ncbi:hypothetical protein [Christiangramia sp.]|uniref:hypothetical protein n=1 Tax=Christiangramia sp. TaxID=1931228 RepID=UPI00261AEB74|nr:hypothetical protein [Christiangramia sp.]
MKRFTIYRDIRKKALIFGLAVGSFAVQMTSVIASLLLIIFSFNLVMIILLIGWNMGLYIFLLRAKTRVLFSTVSSRIELLSNKQLGIDGYKD